MKISPLIWTLCLFIFFLSRAAAQQKVAIQWQKSLGGSGDDRINSIKQTNDGGYIVAGWTSSTDGDVMGNNGNNDYLVIKLDGSGNIQWQKCLGGTGVDEAYDINQTSDGGYIVAGWASSNNRDVNGNHGESDYWIVKLAENGDVQWQKCLGGTDVEGANSIQETVDGGYIVIGVTYSNDGDVSGNHQGAAYGNDYWIVKLDGSGNIQWQNCFGGTDYDWAYSIQQSTDGGYIVAGTTLSNDGDVRGNHGSSDMWILKLDGTGTIQWQKCLGGTGIDEARAIQEATDGGYIVAGYTSSNDGDVISNNGTWNYWILKLDISGNIQWQKCLGGTKDNKAHAFQQTSDGGNILAGFTNSNDGDVKGNHGSLDSWVVKMDVKGNIQWQKCLGGTSEDMALSIQEVTEDGYIVAGWTSSNDGDVSGNHGVRDFWIVKLTDKFNTITGTCFIDYNQNNIQDNGEPSYPRGLVSSMGSTYNNSAATDSQGFYENTIADTGSITTKVQNLDYYSISPAQHTSNFSSYNNTDTANFALVPIADIQDLRITLIPVTRARPGRGVTYRIAYENIGTKTISGSIFFKHSPLTSFISSNPAYTSVSGNRMEWSYANLAPNELSNIDVTMLVSPTAQAGSFLVYDALIEPVATDTTPPDNATTLDDIVMASYDPNDKTMLGGNEFTTAQVANKDYLTYLIRFQNTGNDTAFTVVIRDTLDNQFDLSAFEMLSSSHNYSLVIENNKNITWTLDNILLPDSNINEQGSHGYVCYRIKAKSNVTTGDIIRNKAYIYFDYNAAVVTNTAETKVVFPTGIKTRSGTAALSLHPNPSSDFVILNLPFHIAGAKLNVLNTLGQVVITRNFISEQTIINTKELPAGIYLVRVQMEGTVYTARLVKM